MLKTYKIGFDWYGLILFLIIMIPNFVWFVIPAPADVLRTKSVTEIIDMVGSFCQVLMVISLCIIINRNYKRLKISGKTIGAGCCIILYYICWGIYYLGITDAKVILGLTIFPCVAFLLYSFEKKNIIAAFFAGIFSVCHIIYGIINYIV